MKEGRARFLSISEATVRFAGGKVVLVAAVGLVIIWCAAGIMARLPIEWFFLTNMFGTAGALFMLLIMQHSQNRDMAALQVKIDNLIRSSDTGNHMIGVERMEANDIVRLAGNRSAGLDGGL
ncbi:hypothetical protein HGP17_09315 [Rhizobium sp. P38BS-XIX]|uniref:low affinity iron permease family protein n=1 Tax=Rhizobium sp. P38BS-XIX TaxID=2726740 RepID=UPI001456DDF5|nr:low affinity iron permease family protein [Rhizobium sp. P38BS-XIX]NLR97034.1 hypothetical protein [Rhizobium sp. P38BS-XIX]